MKNFGTVERNKLNADGTPRNQYDLQDVKPNDGYFRIAAAFLIGNALLIAKNVFFTADAKAKDEAGQIKSGLSVEEVGKAGEAARFRVVDGHHTKDKLQAQNDEPLQPIRDEARSIADVGADTADLRHADNSKVVNFPSIRKIGNISAGPPASVANDGDQFHISVPTSAPIPSLSSAASTIEIANEDDSQHRRQLVNRLPVVAAVPIALGDLYINQSIAIAMTDLLRGAYDPDGDALEVRNLKVSSGDLTHNEGNGWHFEPTSLSESTVTFRFEVSDQIGSTPHTAELQILGLAGADIFGTPGEDILTGTERMDKIVAYEGNDLIFAGADNDIIRAGAGDDIVHAGAGDDIVYAGSGDDIVYAGTGDDFVFGEDGNDTIHGEAGDDTLNGGSGDDIIYGDDGDDTVAGDDGNDQLAGGGGNDLLIGGAGSDVGYGGDGNDVIVAGGDDDFIYAGTGDDLVQAGTGDDLVFGQDGNDTITGDEGDDVVSGGADNDTIDGGSGDDVLLGDAGNDHVAGNVGNDVLIGDTGDDDLTGGDGDDLLIGGTGDDSIAGDDGDDIILASTDDGDDTIDGGIGTDTYDTSQAQGDININLGSGQAEGERIGNDTLNSIENVVAGSGDDILTGDDLANLIKANDGDDVVMGAGGDDNLDGGDGDDTFVATTGDGNDIIDGGDGVDTYDASQTTDGVIIDLNEGTSTSSDGEHDALQNIENAFGGSGNDKLIASDAINILRGGAGQDVFVFLEGNKSGSGGHTRDRIEDFEVGDKIDFSSFDGNSQEDGFQRLQFNFTDAEFNGIGQAWVRYQEEDGSETVTLLQFKLDDIDIDDGEIEFEIEIVGRHEIDENSLIL